MRRIFYHGAILVATLALSLVACNSKNEPAKVSEAKKITDSSKLSSEQDTASNVTHQGVSDSSHSVTAIRAAEDARVPVYLKITIDHFKNVTVLMRENISDCRMVIDAITNYIEENKIEIEDAIKAGDEAQAKMSAPEKTRLAMQVKELFSPIMQEVGVISIEFAENCKNDVKKLSDLLKSLGARTEGL